MSDETAEQIAAVIADIRAGRVEHPAGFDEPGIVTSLKSLRRAEEKQPVVDCTAIYATTLKQSTVALYDDFPSITPPWQDAMLCYVNSFGNVIVLQVHRDEWDGTPHPDWHTQNDVNWPAVRWIAETDIWVGGKNGQGKPLPTSGPCHRFRHAITKDGAAEDINWLHLMKRASEMEYETESDGMWDTPLVVLGASLNFLGASNVGVAEPVRSRPTRRRMARIGVTVETIVVRPPGKRRATSTAPRPLEAGEQVFSPVRGHFARYGPTPEDPHRGLLFGKYAGKFWISAHARGARDGGAETTRDYALRPGRKS